MAPNRKQVDVLVTGASGFLGSRIVSSLFEKHPEWRISTLDITPIASHLQPHLHRTFTADVTSLASIQDVFSNYTPDLVMHSAGIVPARTDRYSTRASDWARVKAINYDGTRHVFDSAVASGCRKFVYTSSCTAVIDDLDHDYFNVDESVPLGLATLHYGKSKALAETYVLQTAAECPGVQACALRPTTIIGEGDVAVIGVLYDLIAKGETNFIVGDGDNLYDFMYIDNAVLGHVLTIENLLVGDGSAAGQAFFISNQEPVYFWDFLAFVWAQFGHVPAFRVRIPLGLAWVVALVLEWVTWVTGASATLDTGSVKDGVRTHYADNSRAQRVLGYYPVVGLSEGVRRACRYYKQYLEDNDRLREKVA